MDNWLLQTVLTIVGTVIASSGFWAFIQSRDVKRSAQREILLGLAHEAIINRCNIYIERGYIYEDEYKDLHDYLYKPYRNLGGNGSAERAIHQVRDNIEMRYR